MSGGMEDTAKMFNEKYGPTPLCLNCNKPISHSEMALIPPGAIQTTLCFDCKNKLSAKHDLVNHPKHYTNHPEGIECIQITRHMNFNLGNAIKYIWRAGEKGDQIQDLQKAIWYLNDEITRLEKSLNRARDKAD